MATPNRMLVAACVGTALVMAWVTDIQQSPRARVFAMSAVLVALPAWPSGPCCWTSTGSRMSTTATVIMLATEVLVAVTEAVAGELRQSYVFGRLGGEESLVLVPDADIAGGTAVAERLTSAVQAARVSGSDGKIAVTVSIGVAAIPAGDDSWTHTLRLADQRLYLAKRAGRNRVVASVDPSAAGQGSDDLDLQ